MTKKENKLKKNIKEFNEVIEKCNQDILDLKKQKNGKFKNIFFKIISFGFYDWNRKIENKIKYNNSIIELFKEKILQTNKMIIKINNKKTAMVKKQNIKNEIYESKNINISSKTESSLQQEENK
ncbi:hypothetical protein [Spiroplasma endosymbiont of Lariophagus distinguendus]|uniref:hypothetical protein n=1 Tax=Spiroplasma endosymbiont of Lariophagus distinguendus TaxID=2935082 RepID=UPI002079E5F7|nr:hypothetical protein [Spiroplasma endosymbiont of Lariophagus distinguendus]